MESSSNNDLKSMRKRQHDDYDAEDILSQSKYESFGLFSSVK
jgi:hypothetical protein